MSQSPIYCAGLDIGSAMVRAVILRLEEGQVWFGGLAEVESSGWKKSRLENREKVAACVLHAQQRAESTLLKHLEGAVVGLGGSGLAGVPSQGDARMQRAMEIRDQEIEAAIEDSTHKELGVDRMVAQILPQDFIIDSGAMTSNPRRRLASRLLANTLLVTASAIEHQLIVDAVNEAHMHVEETIFEAYAAAYASTTREERERGLAVIDIGLDSTEVIVFNGEAAAGAFSVPFGGRHFTQDLAYMFQLGWEDAERIKLEFGAASLERVTGSTRVELPSAPGREAREKGRWEIVQYLEARAEELFNAIALELRPIVRNVPLNEGVVVCGGGAMMPDMLDMAEKHLHSAARFGLPPRIDGWPESQTNPAWTTAAGLALYSARLAGRRQQDSGLNGLLAMLKR
jgi:cell division protein FtsA